MIQNKITEEEMLASLERSGYLLESEITKHLVNNGFFVESNLTSLDPLTGKSREIDLLAEYNHIFNNEWAKNKVVAQARLVFEIKNNNSPFVLLTQYEQSPNSELYNGLKSRRTIPVNLKNIFYLDFYNALFDAKDKKIFTQYCSFTKKKNEELMAHHPDNVYSGLLKIAYFCEEMTNEDSHEVDVPISDYLRDFLYLPILLINDDLYELTINDSNNNKLEKVNCSYLTFNYHYMQEPQTTIIHVVTKEGLDTLLSEILNAEKDVLESMNLAKDLMLKELR